MEQARASGLWPIPAPAANAPTLLRVVIAYVLAPASPTVAPYRKRPVNPPNRATGPFYPRAPGKRKTGRRTVAEQARGSRSCSPGRAAARSDAAQNVLRDQFSPRISDGGEPKKRLNVRLK